MHDSSQYAQLLNRGARKFLQYIYSMPKISIADTLMYVSYVFYAIDKVDIDPSISIRHL